MNLSLFRLRQRAADLLTQGRACSLRLVSAVVSVGPVRCARLALALVCGIAAAAALVCLALAALLILAPVAVVVVVTGGAALAAWPYGLPKVPAIALPAKP